MITESFIVITLMGIYPTIGEQRITTMQTDQSCQRTAAKFNAEEIGNKRPIKYFCDARTMTYTYDPLLKAGPVTTK